MYELGSEVGGVRSFQTYPLKGRAVSGSAAPLVAGLLVESANVGCGWGQYDGLLFPDTVTQLMLSISTSSFPIERFTIGDPVRIPAGRVLPILSRLANPPNKAENLSNSGIQFRNPTPESNSASGMDLTPFSVGFRLLHIII